VRAQTGFTLLGLLFMLAVMGVGMAALGTIWHTAAQREKERDLLFIGNQYRQAIESFWNQSPGTRRLPKDFDELLSDPRFPNTVRHLRRAYRDPLTPEGKWGVVREADGGISGVYSLSAARPFKRAGFATGYAQFSEAETHRDWVFRFDHEKAEKDAKAKEKTATQPAPGVQAVPSAGAQKTAP
jgi:type II secretory pathway pseudopilin PulG